MNEATRDATEHALLRNRDRLLTIQRTYANNLSSAADAVREACMIGLIATDAALAMSETHKVAAMARLAEAR